MATDPTTPAPPSRDTHPYAIQIGRAHVCTPVTPRSTLFPNTTLFRSKLVTGSRGRAVQWVIHGNSPYYSRTSFKRHSSLRDPDRKSTRLHSSHTEIYTLSQYDALPI